MNATADNIQMIFFAAIEKHSPEQRRSFLDDACAGNAELRARVEELLAAHVAMGSIHERASPASANTLDHHHELAGTIIGPYKLLEQIGEGGMGLVYMAEQQQPMRRLGGLDGKRLASAGYSDPKIKVWDAQTGQELLKLNDSGPSVAFSPDGKRLASGRKVWDVETGKELLSVKDGGGMCVAFSPDGKRLVSNHVYAVKVRDTETGDQLLTLHGHTAGVTSVVFTPDGSRIASGSRDGTVKVWEATTKQEARTFRGLTRGVSFSPDGKRLAFGTYGRRNGNKQGLEGVEVIVVDPETGKQLLACKGHAHWINSVSYSPDGKRLASASSDKTVKVWDAQTGREIITFNGHTGKVVSVAFSPDGTRLASSMSDANGFSMSAYPGERAEVKIWNAETGQELLTLEGHKRFVNSVAFSPGGKRLATLSRDNTIKVWDVQTGQELLTLKTLVSGGGCVAFSADGKRLASSDDPPRPYVTQSSRVKVWDAQTGEELLTLNGHTAPVESVAFSPDGKRLFTGAGGHPSGHGEVKVWDALTGQELLTLDGRSGPCNDMALSPDGNRLIAQAMSGAGMIKIWDATPLPEKP